MAAIDLEMPDRVPRTEYSAETHWKLIERVTGIHVESSDDEELKKKASNAFRKAWSYDFMWNTLIVGDEFGEKKTSMGHAVYAANGTDFDERVNKLYTDPDEALKFDPWELYGEKNQQVLIDRFNENYAWTSAYYSDAVHMTGTYVTLVSGLIEIFGWDMLLTASGTDPDGFGAVADRYASWIMQYFEALAKSDAPVVMIHDDIVWTSGAFIRPDWYRRFVFPNYKRMFTPLIESGKKIMYTSDGTYTEFIDDIAACGVHGFVLEPTTDMQYIADKYGKTHAFIGNADTRILLSGTKDDIYNEVKRCMDIGKNCPGFFMAVGNHIPSNTPVENALYYNEVYEKMSRR